MKQTTASYQFELSEKELDTVCTALKITLSQTKQLCDALKHKLEKEKVSDHDAQAYTEDLIKAKDELKSYHELYNGFGRPIGKFSTSPSAF